MNKRSALLVLFATVGLLAGCSSSGPMVIELTATGSKFNQPKIEVAKGQAVKLVLKNQDKELHDFSVDHMEAKVEKAAAHGGDHNMGGHAPDLHVSADAGKSGEVVFTPTKAGIYEFYCTVPGHKAMGMVGTLVVK